MAYRTQPIAATGGLAVPAGAGSVTIVAAPGLGFRLRLVAGYVSVSRLTGLCDVTLEDLPIATVVMRQVGLAPAGNPALPIELPEPGISFPENHGIQAVLNGSAAGGTFNATLFYFLDAIT